MNKQIKSDAGSRRSTGALGKITFLAAFVLSLAGCSGGGGGGGGGGGCNLTIEEIEAIGNINDLPAACLALLPVPENNLLGRIFILGTQEDQDSGVLRIFVTGTDSDGNPIILDDFETATVTVDDGFNPEVVHQADPPPNLTSLVTVEPVADGDKILSVGFATDYSDSISQPELTAISGVFSLILEKLTPPNLLPQILEGMVINFADTVVVHQQWTEVVAAGDLDFALDPVLLNDPVFRNGTAFYDALGVALQRDAILDDNTGDGLGLVERCRPAHLQIAFTDGLDNASETYAKDDVDPAKINLLPIIDASSAVMIMLGSLAADKDSLVELAGDRGAFAYAYNLAAIQDTVSDWASSLSEMVKFTLESDTLFNAVGATITITVVVGGETLTAEVIRPTDGFCEAS